MHPSYNVAPTQEVAVVVQRDGRTSLEGMRWGLIPFWAKDPSIGSRMINARAESIADKPAFKRSLRDRRCLVLADGFYEWQKSDGAKIPVYIRLKSGRPFAFAGLYDLWNPPSGGPIASCTIITTGPNDLMTPIHNRMPVILGKAEDRTWLDAAIREPQQLLSLLNPFPAGEMEAYRVSTLANSPRNNSPALIQPLRE